MTQKKKTLKPLYKKLRLWAITVLVAAGICSALGGCERQEAGKPENSAVQSSELSAQSPKPSGTPEPAQTPEPSNEPEQTAVPTQQAAVTSTQPPVPSTAPKATPSQISAATPNPPPIISVQPVPQNTTIPIQMETQNPIPTISIQPVTPDPAPAISIQPISQNTTPPQSGNQGGNSAAISKSNWPAGTFLGSELSDKYHSHNCRAAQKILPENEIWFSSEGEAQAAGYSRCGICW